MKKGMSLVLAVCFAVGITGVSFGGEKATAAEAETMVKKAIAYLKTNGKVSGTPSILLTPLWITKANYKKLFTDGFLKRSQVCIGIYKKYCK